MNYDPNNPFSNDPYSGAGESSSNPETGVQATSGKAITALVTGILGLVVLPIVFSVLAIFFGAIARKDIDKDPKLKGRGMATAGLVLGIIGIVIGVVFGILILSKYFSSY